MKTFKETLLESDDIKFKISMNTIRRALGNEVPTKKDLDEFIEISIESNKFNDKQAKDFKEYVYKHIKYKN